MNYKKSFLVTALALGLGLTSNAQTAKFSLNGLGRSILTNSQLGGTLVENDNLTQKKGISGYNLFDLQNNLAIDSAFKATAILRVRSPFGSFFGATTRFEFRQFNMSGNLKKFKYEIGDIRVELTPFTVYNSNIIDHSYDSEIFKMRRDILEYENFNDGNTWLLQGAQGQYFWSTGDDGSGLGIYAFTTRNTSTNELDVPDRLLSGGRLEYRVGNSIIIGYNNASMYDLDVVSSAFNLKNFVHTGDLKYTMDNDGMRIDLAVEGGGSQYTWTENVNGKDTVTGYDDGFIDVNANVNLKSSKVNLGVNIKAVGADFRSPSAQTRRINDAGAPGVLPMVQQGVVERGQVLFDRFTSEDLYQNRITPSLEAFLPYYNNSTPYGKATPNRVGGGIAVSTDTSNKALTAGLKFDYATEMIGEGGDAKRAFMVLNAGGVGHIGKMMDSDRLLDVNLGVRFENTSRSEGASVDLTSSLVDFGIAIETIKRLDVLAGLKFLTVEGNEYSAVRDQVNEVTSFTSMKYDMTQMIFGAGVRVRFSPYQFFTLNYNYADLSNNLNSTESYNMSQLFLNYTGRF